MGFYRDLLLEVKRSANGNEEELDNDKENDVNYDLSSESEKNEDDEHNIQDGANDYNLDDEMGNDNSDENLDDQNTDNPDNMDNNNDTQDDNSPDNIDKDQPDDPTSNYDLGDEMDGDGGSDPDTGGDTNDNNDMEMNDSNSPSDNDQMNDTNDNMGDNDQTSIGNDNSDMNGEEGNQDPDAKIKEIENSITSLNPEQLKIQNVNLKKQYIELYNNCGNIIQRLNDINKNSDIEAEITFTIQSIQDLKKVIFDYLVNVYDTKTFVQNTVNYSEYLVTLNSVYNIIKDINSKNKDKK